VWVATPEHTIEQITEDMNDVYDTNFTPEQIVKINGISDVNNIKTGNYLKIGTPDGWQPPEETSNIDEEYWEDLDFNQQKILHYHRNFYQPVPELPKTNKGFSWFDNWDSKGETSTHNVGTSGNIDYRGMNEFKGIQAVYDKDGNLVTTPENMGTYDYISPNDNIFDHLNVDVKTWIELGNSTHDTTTKEERVNSMKTTLDSRIGLYKMGYIKFIEIITP